MKKVRKNERMSEMRIKYSKREMECIMMRKKYKEEEKMRNANNRVKRGGEKKEKGRRIIIENKIGRKRAVDDPIP